MRGLGILADRAGGLEAVEVGHDHVHQDQVGLFRLGHFHASSAVFGGKGFMPEFFDDPLDAKQL
ncbi:hypothetical protein GCM10009121_14020 [Rhodanobacter soli]